MKIKVEFVPFSKTIDITKGFNLVSVIQAQECVALIFQSTND